MKTRRISFSIVITVLCFLFAPLAEAVTYAITPNPATVGEAAGSITFTITRSGGTPAETIYASTLQTEGFVNNSDYVGFVNQLVTFTSGQVSKTVTLTILDDTTVESSETFALIVQRNSTDPNTTYLAKTTFTITDNDVTPTTYSITPNPATVAENAGSLTFTITRSGGTPAETIYASTAQTEGYSNSGDYNGLTSQAVSFTAGQTSKTVSLTILDDTTVESSEKFALIVQRNASDPIGTYLAKATFTITDNDVTPTTYSITPNPATVAENAGSLTFTISRSGGTPAETIYASTAQTEGYSNSGDYNGLTSQAVSFTAGQTSKTVSLTILDDSTVESSETFALIVQRNASDPIGTYLAKTTFTITDNDVLPTTYAITPNPATVDEGAGTITFTITRSGGTPAETIYANTTMTEGSVNNSDYTGFVNQPVIFTSGQLSSTVSVTISNDTTVESSETFGFIVQRNTSDPVTTYLAKSTFTITDNDLLPTTYAITPNPATVGEAAGSITFTITRSGGTPAETIYASTLQTEGSVNNSDYVGFVNQLVTFTSGQVSKTVTLTILDDTTVESSETFALIVQRNSTDPNTTYLAKTTFTITDNDQLGCCDILFDGEPNLSPSQVTAGETVVVTYTIRNSGQVSAGATQTKIQIKNSSGVQVVASTFSEPSLAPAGSVTQHRSISIPSGTPRGSYVAFVILDNQRVLVQTSTANDYAGAISFSVITAPSEANKPDLAVGRPPSLSSLTVLPGASVDVTFSVNNIGLAASPAVDVLINLIDAANNVVESSRAGIPSLGAGAGTGNQVTSLLIPAGTASGAYSVRYVIQASGIDQANYGNDYSPSTRIQVSSSEPVAIGDLIQGVDVSSHQGTINWQQVRAAGMQFAYIKATEDNQPMHPTYFNANYPAAKAAGLIVGAYHFANPLLAAPYRNSAWGEPERSAKTEAAQFVAVAGPVLTAGNLPPALDLEAHAVSYIESSPGIWVVDKSFADPNYGESSATGLLDPLARMGSEALSNWAIDWCSEVERLSGVKPVVYMTKSYATALAPYLKNRYGLWIAATSDTPGEPVVTSWGSWNLHQYNWYGTVSGISGNADLNVLRGPISDRVIQSARIASRGRLTVDGNTIRAEISGADSQVITVQGTTSLTSTWEDLLEIQLVNGFGEVIKTIDTSNYFLRIKP